MAFKSKYGKWILVLAILLIALALPKLLVFSKNSGGTTTASDQQKLLPVQAQVVQPKLLQNTIRTTGNAAGE
jgi:hypothetical protein